MDRQSVTQYPSLRLQGLPLRERPVERVEQVGAGAVSLTELLAVLVGGARQLEIADQMVARYQGVHEIAKAPVAELCAVKGVGRRSAVRLKAALELGRRLLDQPADERPQIRSPKDAGDLLVPEMSLLEQEHFRVVLLNTKNRVIGMTTVYVGNVNSIVIRPAEVFLQAVRRNAPSLIVAHNHPSGDVSPSPDDISISRTLLQAGQTLGIEVLDHIIVGKGHYLSLKEQGHM